MKEVPGVSMEGVPPPSVTIMLPDTAEYAAEDVSSSPPKISQASLSHFGTTLPPLLKLTPAAASADMLVSVRDDTFSTCWRAEGTMMRAGGARVVLEVAAKPVSSEMGADLVNV
jgi:hypothetical protein